MTSFQVVRVSVTATDNNPFQDNSHMDSLIDYKDSVESTTEKCNLCLSAWSYKCKSSKIFLYQNPSYYHEMLKN